MTPPTVLASDCRTPPPAFHSGAAMPEDDPPLTRAQIEAMFRFADDLLEQARARARARRLTPAEIEAEEIDDDSEFWDDVRTIGPTGLASALGERFAMDSRGPRLSHQTKPLQVCPCADGGAARSISTSLGRTTTARGRGCRVHGASRKPVHRRCRRSDAASETLMLPRRTDSQQETVSQLVDFGRWGLRTRAVQRDCGDVSLRVQPGAQARLHLGAPASRGRIFGNPTR